MKKLFLIIIVLTTILLFPQLLSAQYENTSGQEGSVQKHKTTGYKPSRWFTGGMLGAGFSSYSSYVQVAPIIGYKVTPAFHVGSRITYIYEGFKDNYTGRKYNLHNYGASLFTRYALFKFLFLQAEYEVLSVPVFPYEGERRAVNSFFVGGGIMQNFGGSGFATISILYNVLDDQYSPYSNPLIRIGFGVGF